MARKMLSQKGRIKDVYTTLRFLRVYFYRCYPEITGNKSYNVFAFFKMQNKQSKQNTPWVIFRYEKAKLHLQHVESQFYDFFKVNNQNYRPTGGVRHILQLYAGSLWTFLLFLKPQD